MRYSHLFELVHQRSGILESFGIFAMQALGENLIDNPVLAWEMLASGAPRSPAQHLTPIGNHGLHLLELRRSYDKSREIRNLECRGYMSRHA